MASDSELRFSGKDVFRGIFSLQLYSACLQVSSGGKPVGIRQGDPIKELGVLFV
jgi:hypothetical protein